MCECKKKKKKKKQSIKRKTSSQAEGPNSQASTSVLHHFLMWTANWYIHQFAKFNSQNWTELTNVYIIHQLFNLDVIFIYFLKILFIFRERGWEGEKEGDKHQCVVASHCPQLGTQPTSQASALIGNGTSNPLVCRPALSPLSHTNQGYRILNWDLV